jgi:DNA helicase-2/ATP-dependent DNA helicase PcrA
VGAARVAVEQLEHTAAAFTTRRSFLRDLTLDLPRPTTVGPPLVDDEYLILSTVHSAKATSGMLSTSSAQQTR